MSFSYGFMAEGEQKGKVMQFPSSHIADKATTSNKGKRVVTKKKFKSNKLMMVILGIMMIYGVIGFSNQYYKIHIMNQEMLRVNKQIKEIELKNSELREQITQMQSSAYVEREARKKLGLVKPGEKVIIPAYKTDNSQVD